MTELDDHELLAAYARTESESAFATLVARHVNLVHSVARRQVGDGPLAQEITQAHAIAREFQRFLRQRGR